MMDAVFLAVMMLLVLGVCVSARLRWSRRPRSAGENRPPRSELVAPVSCSVVKADSKREESALVALRLAGDISPGRYQQRMAGLARIDALRNPVVVPPDHGS